MRYPFMSGFVFFVVLLVSAGLPAVASPGSGAGVAPAVPAAILPSGPTGPGLTGAGLSGERGTYIVRAGDNLTLVAARLGASMKQLQRETPLDRRGWLTLKQAVAYDNRHIVPPAPSTEGDVVLVNIPQRMLFHFRNGSLRAAYPAAAGRPTWQTPTIDTRIATREKGKVWVVPPSIQAEMRAKGERVLTRVPPGPDNPLGQYWLGLAAQGYGIHGTNAPASVYSSRTHGCIRLQPEHIEVLFNNVVKGVPVRIIYAPVLLYMPPDGPIWLEAHPDVYARGLDYPALARQLADEAGAANRIDWNLADQFLNEQDGIARDVTKH